MSRVMRHAPPSPFAIPSALHSDLEFLIEHGRTVVPLTDKRVRRGSFANVPALVAAIKDYLDNHNQQPQVFVWSAPVARILAKIAQM